MFQFQSSPPATTMSMRGPRPTSKYKTLVVKLCMCVVSPLYIIYLSIYLQAQIRCDIWVAGLCLTALRGLSVAESCQSSLGCRAWVCVCVWVWVCVWWGCVGVVGVVGVGVCVWVLWVWVWVCVCCWCVCGCGCGCGCVGTGGYRTVDRSRTVYDSTEKD